MAELDLTDKRVIRRHVSNRGFKHEPKGRRVRREAFEYEFIVYGVFMPGSEPREALVTNLGEELLPGDLYGSGLSRRWIAAGEVRCESIEAIHSALEPDGRRFAVNDRFNLAPSAKPDIRAEVEQSAEARVWIDSVEETGIPFIRTGNVEVATGVTQRCRALQTMILPVQ